MGEDLNIRSVSLFERTTVVDRPVNPFGSEFYRDLLASYGLEVEESAYLLTDFSPFEPLICTALDQLEAESKQGVDFLVLAHYLPNAIGYNSTTSYLLDREKWDAFAFAVSDQQTGAMLSAVRFAAQYLKNGYKKAVVIGVDQTALPIASKLVKEREAVDNATVMILESGESTGALQWWDSGSISLGQGMGITLAAEVARVTNTFNIPSSDLSISCDPSWADFVAAELPSVPLVRSPTRYLATGAVWSLADWAKTMGERPGFLLNVDFSLGRMRSTLYKKNSQPFAGVAS